MFSENINNMFERNRIIFHFYHAIQNVVKKSDGNSPEKFKNL